VDDSPIARARRVCEADQAQLVEDQQALAEATQARESFEGKLHAEHQALEGRRVACEDSYRKGNPIPLSNLEEQLAEFSRRERIVLQPEVARLRALEEDAQRRVATLRAAIPVHEGELQAAIDAEYLSLDRLSDDLDAHAARIFEAVSVLREAPVAMLEALADWNSRASAARARSQGHLSTPDVDALQAARALDDAFDNRLLTSADSLYALRDVLADPHGLTTKLTSALTAALERPAVSAGGDFAEMRPDFPSCHNVGEVLLRHRERLAGRSAAAREVTDAIVAAKPIPTDWKLIPRDIQDCVARRIEFENDTSNPRQVGVDQRQWFERCLGLLGVIGMGSAISGKPGTPLNSRIVTVLPGGKVEPLPGQSDLSGVSDVELAARFSRQPVDVAPTRTLMPSERVPMPAFAASSPGGKPQ
jgi:hypothetical protein